LLNAAGLASVPSKAFAAIQERGLTSIHLDARRRRVRRTGTLKHRIDRDWLSAEKRFAEALALSPASPVCHLAVGRALRHRATSRGGESHVRRANSIRSTSNRAFRARQACVMTLSCRGGAQPNFGA